MRKSCIMVNCRVGHNWRWMGANNGTMGAMMRSHCSVRGQHWSMMRSSQSMSGVMWSGQCMMRVNSCKMGCMMRGRGGVMSCMMWGGNCCMMSCMVRVHSMRQLSMSGVTGLDDLRGRPDLSRWLATRV